MRILIAEDDQVLADGLLRTLRASGAAVDHVPNGSEADAALMTSNEFDLIILDLGLPKMHGLEVLKRLRARGSSMPVLALSTPSFRRLRRSSPERVSSRWVSIVRWTSLSCCLFMPVPLRKVGDLFDHLTAE